MKEESLTEYDKVLYDSQPIERTHPSMLAPLGRLFGIPTKALSEARVLELGCGSGCNLFGLAAAYPEASFVGVDLAQVQIARGKKTAAEAKLENLELFHRSILEITPNFGQFDYILCHGIYSWVPAEVREGILSVFANNLSAAGICYLSYNTYPGWHIRETIREMMDYASRHLDNPAQRAAAAKRWLSFFLKAESKLKNYDTKLLAEAETILKLPSWYLHHDVLAEINQPFYFEEVVKSAKLNGLQYLSEAEIPKNSIQDIPAELQRELCSFAKDKLAREQFLDFSRNTMFRRSLFVKDDLTLRENFYTEALDELFLSSNLRIESSDLDLYSSTEVLFKSRKGGALRCGMPILKSALIVLAEHYPEALSFSELYSKALTKLGYQEQSKAEALEADYNRLGASLLRAYVADLIELRVEPSRAKVSTGHRPRTSNLARYEAQKTTVVTNLLNERINLSEAECSLLCLLDGEKTLEELLSIGLPSYSTRVAIESSLLSLSKQGLISQ